MKEKKILYNLTEIFIFVIIIFFPLIINSSGFFHILECKWYFFLTASLTYILLVLFVFLYFLLFKKINYIRYMKFTWVQYLAICFLIINIISCFFSPYFNSYNLFIGVGRGEGLVMMSLYIISFLLISLLTEFKKRHILYFSISSIFINFIAILQYIGFNPFNMYQNGIGTHNVSFMSTIGNVDFISAVLCIFLSVSFAAFIFISNNKMEKIIHFLSVLFGFFIFGIINVNSGKLALLSTVIIIFPFIFSNNKRFGKFLILFSTILLTYCVNHILNLEYHYNLKHLIFNIKFDMLAIIFLVVCLILYILAKEILYTKYDFSKNKKFFKWYYLSIITIGIFSIILIYCINFTSGTLYEVHEILHGNFSDSFGTYRVFLWKRSLNIFTDFPLIGTGPDTFAIRFMSEYTQDVAKIGPLTINDTAANVYLTILVNLGIVGIVIYLAFICYQIKYGLKKMNNYSKVLLIAMICYFIQDFFNLSVVIVSPIFWVLMGLHYSSLNIKG